MPLRTVKILLLFLVATLPGFFSEGGAQDISQYYTVRNAEKFATDWHGFYLKIDEMTKATRQRLPHFLNLSYGDDPKQALDLYIPKKPVKNAPVVVFFHGGNFIEGDRAHYGFVADAFADKGVIVAVAGYRLASAGYQFPAQIDDAKSSVLWLNRHVAEFGGNPRNMVLVGHSVGGLIVAALGTDRTWLDRLGLPVDVIGSIAAISGQYDIGEGYLDWYAASPEAKHRASPVHHVKRPVARALVAYGGEEAQLQLQNLGLQKVLADEGGQVVFQEIDGADHRATATTLADLESPLFKAVFALVQP